jgi:hypothetical protein
LISSVDERGSDPVASGAAGNSGTTVLGADAANAGAFTSETVAGLAALIGLPSFATAESAVVIGSALRWNHKNAAQPATAAIAHAIPIHPLRPRWPTATNRCVIT